MSKRIKFLVGDTLRIEGGEGFHGPECETPIRAIMQALGLQQEGPTDYHPEFHEEVIQEQQESN